MAVWVLLGVTTLGLVIFAPIYLLITQSGLKRRIDRLEHEIARLEIERRSASGGLAKVTPTKTPAADIAASEAVQEARAEPSGDTVSASPETAAAAREAAPSETEPDEGLSRELDLDPPPVPSKRPNHFGQFIAWLGANWVLAAGAVSLALAGVFLVQYGVEIGLLTPLARVLAALAFGLLLISGGEVLRRRFGDETDSDTRFLPSALSGAGFLTMFATVLAAQALYGLISTTATLAGLVLVSAFAIVFGWFYGPMLSAVGVVGAIVAPYLVGGETDSPWVFCYYFTLVALVALSVDSVKRWAWLSVLGCAGAAASVWLTFLGAGFPVHFLVASLLLACAAMTVPLRQLLPRHEGPPISAIFINRWDQAFPVWLGAAGVANATGAALYVGLWGNLAEGYLALAALCLLFLGTTFALSRAIALVDLVVLPLLAFFALIAGQAMFRGAFYDTFQMPLEPEAAMPGMVWQLVALSVVASLLGLTRLGGALWGGYALFWGIGCAAVAPVTVFLLEFLWVPAAQYGDYGWALIVLGTAAAMTLGCERSLRVAGLPEPKLYASLFAAAALVLIGLALFLMLTKAALTLALAVMVLLVVGLDRRFNLPLLGPLDKLGSLIIGYRVVFDPGVDWATRSETQFAEVLLTYVGTAVVLLLAHKLTRPERVTQRAGLEGSLSVLVAAFLFTLCERLLPGDGLSTHWGLGLLAALWLVVIAERLRNISSVGKLERWLKIGVAIAIGIPTAFAIFMLFDDANPLRQSDEIVLGVPFFSSLALAYLPLAGVLGVIAWRIDLPMPQYRVAVSSASVFLVAWYVALSIRHFWQGPVLSVPGVSDPELYTYTIAMILASTGALVIAFLRRSTWLRRVSMVCVGITIAKVFLVDMEGLRGLMRALSFMGLGLSLLGLTWLNRVMAAQWDRRSPASSDG